MAQLAHGGRVFGRGGPRSDNISAKLSPGEYVLPADTVQAVGVEKLDALRHATHEFPVSSHARGFQPAAAFADGGAVAPDPTATPANPAAPAPTQYETELKQRNLATTASSIVASPERDAAVAAMRRQSAAPPPTLSAGLGAGAGFQPESQWQRDLTQRNLETTASSIVPSAERTLAQTRLGFGAQPATASMPTMQPRDPLQMRMADGGFVPEIMRGPMVSALAAGSAPARGFQPAREELQREATPHFADGGIVDDERRFAVVTPSNPAGVVAVEGFNPEGRPNAFSGRNVSGQVSYATPEQVAQMPRAAGFAPQQQLNVAQRPASAGSAAPIGFNPGGYPGASGDRAMLDNQIRAANLRDRVPLETGVGGNAPQALIFPDTGGFGILDKGYQKARALDMAAQSATADAARIGRAAMPRAEATAKALADYETEQSVGPRLAAESSDRVAAARYTADAHLAGQLRTADAHLAGQQLAADSRLAGHHVDAAGRIAAQQIASSVKDPIAAERLLLDKRRADREEKTAALDQAAKTRVAELENTIMNGTPEERQAAAQKKAAMLGKEVAGGGKPMPASAANGLLENMTNLRRAQTAFSLLNGETVDGVAGDRDAVGYKGYLPNAALNRIDPKGVDTRAAIADLGSLIVHDRSGAAVTASEFPRLAPFIPTEKDDAVTARKKLAAFVRNYQAVVDDQVNFYGETGYKVPAQVLRQGGSKEGEPFNARPAPGQAKPQGAAAPTAAAEPPQLAELRRRAAADPALAQRLKDMGY